MAPVLEPGLRRPAVVVAIALPVLLALVVAGLGVTARLGGFRTPPPPPETGPLAVAPVDAPDAQGPECTALLAALPGQLPGDPALSSRPIAEPAPPGVAAWAASPRPVVLRCGLPRPQELTPTSALVVVDGVNWLEISDGAPQPTLTTYVAVDRPVYVALTAPTGLGNGPVTAVSDALAATMPARPVAVR